MKFKAIHKLVPNYISEFVSLKDTLGVGTILDQMTANITSHHASLFPRLVSRSFYMAAPELWNNLPLFIRNTSSVNAFKKALKTNLIISESVSQLIYWFYSLYKVEGFVNRILKSNWFLFLEF